MTCAALRLVPAVPTDHCCNPAKGECAQREIKRLATFETSRPLDGGLVQLRVSLSERTGPDGTKWQCILHQSWLLENGEWKACCKQCVRLAPDARLIEGGKFTVLA